MDIHPPTGPTHSLKDFAIHILIVTIGILIALGLEGVREVWKEQKEVNEARASFQRELRANQNLLKQEMESVETLTGDIDRALALLPEGVKNPGPLAAEVAGFKPALYFFRSTAWESAVASGVLTHMDEDELNRFDEAYHGLKNYQDAQKAIEPDWLSVKAWFASHRTLTPTDLVTGEEKLRSFEARTRIMEHVGEYFVETVKEAVGP